MLGYCFAVVYAVYDVYVALVVYVYAYEHVETLQTFAETNRKDQNRLHSKTHFHVGIHVHYENDDAVVSC
jgi:hypothetical protein